MSIALARKKAKRVFSEHGSLVSEIVGRNAPPTFYSQIAAALSVDRTQSDYRWYSYFRRGKQPGYELASALAKPTENIMAAWTLGDKFTPVTETDATDERLKEFIDDEFDTILTWYVDGLGLGDAYIIVNPDGSLSMASPDSVEVLTADYNYRDVIGYRVTTRLETVTIIDEYYANRRVVTIREAGVSSPQPFVFENPLGVPPVIHWSPGREANEVYGHPIDEPILPLYSRYNDVLSKSLDGVEIMGRPVPVAEGLEDPEAAKELNKTNDETYTDSQGNSKSRAVIDMGDVDMFWLGKGATFKFASPGPFAADSRSMLKALFLLKLEHKNIPEFIWGGAIASSKASADAQMPAFVRIVGLWRVMFEKCLLKLMDVWLRTVSAFEFLPDAGRIQIEWPDVQPSDENVLLSKITLADQMTAITRETALRLMNIVDDPAAEVEAANKEAEERRDQFEQTVNNLNNADDTDPMDDGDETSAEE